MTQKTTANVASLAEAVPGPFGPLTTVTDVDTDLNFDDNTDSKIEFTSDVADTPVFMTYNQLNDAAMRDEILLMAHSGNGLNGWMVMVVESLRTIVTYADSIGSDLYSNIETTNIVKALRSITRLTGSVANDPTPWNKGQVTKIAQVISGTGASRTATLTFTGADPILVMTDWGDGNVDVGAGPNSNTYAIDGTYTIRSTAVGAGGTVYAEEEVVVDVP
jgi:hypothetical protein